MKISVSERISPTVDKVAFAVEGQALSEGVRKAAFNGGRLKTCLLHGKQSKLYIGLGKAEDVDEALLREAAGLAAREMLAIGVDSFGLDVSDYELHAGAIAEGLILGDYKFEYFVPADRRRKLAIKSVTFYTRQAKSKAIRKVINRGKVLAESANLTRELGNLPGNVISPAELATRAKRLATECKLECRVWDPAALRREKFGGILAVGQGSANTPRFISLDYKVPGKKVPTVAVVGKAITFDTGGISLKPGAQMDEMKFDKMGGCAVFGIMRAVAKLKPKVNVVGLIPSAENMPSAKAYRPGDIVTAKDGQTIEVLNTDAEGRIVLADALAYARQNIKADFIIDLATLTGACVVALGYRRAGLYTTDEEAARLLHDLGESTGDQVWRLPLGREYDEMIRSEIATVKNIGGRWAGACTAASFLQQWVGETPWVHLDIAGTAWSTQKRPDLELGATGFGVRLVTGFIEQYFG